MIKNPFRSTAAAVGNRSGFKDNDITEEVMECVRRVNLGANNAKYHCVYSSYPQHSFAVIKLITVLKRLSVLKS